MEDRTYTLTEARMELKRQACALGRHQPTLEIITAGKPAGRWYCDCGSYIYEPGSTARPKQ